MQKNCFMDVWQGPKYASESLWQSWYLKGGNWNTPLRSKHLSLPQKELLQKFQKLCKQIGIISCMEKVYKMLLVYKCYWYPDYLKNYFISAGKWKLGEEFPIFLSQCLWWNSYETIQNVIENNWAIKNPTNFKKRQKSPEVVTDV